MEAETRDRPIQSFCSGEADVLLALLRLGVDDFELVAGLTLRRGEVAALVRRDGLCVLHSGSVGTVGKMSGCSSSSENTRLPGESTSIDSTESIVADIGGEEFAAR